MSNTFTVHAVDPCNGRRDNDGVFHGHAWSVVGIVINNIVYIVGHSRGHYHLALDGEVDHFHCGCCSANYPYMLEAITKVVEQAKAVGATKVIFRKPRTSEIAGLPVEDVENHVGEVGGARIYYRR